MEEIEPVVKEKKNSLNNEMNRYKWQIFKNSDYRSSDTRKKILFFKFSSPLKKASV